MVALIVTVADKYYLQRYDFCLRSVAAYGKKFGIQHVIFDSPSAGLNMKWSKLQRSRELLLSGDDVLLLDADVYATPQATNFLEKFNEFPESDVFVAKGVSGRANSGVMLFRGGRHSKAVEFIDYCLSNRLTPVSQSDFVTSDGENGHVIQSCRFFRSHVHYLDSSWNNSMRLDLNSNFIHFTNVNEVLLEKNHLFPETIQITGRCEAAKRFSHYEDWVSIKQDLLGLEQNQSLSLERIKRLALQQRSEILLPPVGKDQMRDWIWQYEAKTGLLEFPTRFILSCLAGLRDGWFLDGGAHVGYHTFYLNKVSHEIRTIAIEPISANFKLLKSNLRFVPNSWAIKGALGSKSGFRWIFSGSGHTSSTMTKGVHSSAVRTLVRTRTIDDLVKNSIGLSKPNVMMKLDVEGQELDALQGATHSLGGIISSLVLEINPRVLKLSGLSPFDIFSFLESYEMLGFPILENGSLGPSGFWFENTWNYLFITAKNLDSLITPL